MEERRQRAAAKAFAGKWAGRGYEKGESQMFWLSLLSEVYGVEHPDEFISFEEQVHLDHTSFIDAKIPSTHVLIEQKSIDKDLQKPIKQSDGTLLTPFQQAKRYSAELPYSERPRWIVTCNFSEFHVYDMERPGGEPEKILLADLEKDWYRLQFLVDTGSEHLKREMEVSIAAGEIVGLLYDALSKQYSDPTSAKAMKSLNVLCVRLVFCLYAEDAGIFGKHSMFHDYLADFDARGMRRALVELFKILDTRPEDRDPYLKDDNPKLAAFPYVNGGLFADEEIEIPPFTDEIRTLLLAKASDDFDWSEISPTIFGAVFESTLNPETRRGGGMHYTSIENIHKVIDPLFLDDLRKELSGIKEIAVARTQEKRLREFQKKLAALIFLDPAAGSGNFLTETYLSLRRMENEALRLLLKGQMSLGDEYSPIQVSIGQFYGIEINDFAVSVAKTALWIAENQMLRETEDIVRLSLDFLPLTTNATIVEGNALRMDWATLKPLDGSELLRDGLFSGLLSAPDGSEIRYDYIMGNPPFSGARIMSPEQKADVLSVFGSKWQNVGNLDYVACWYKKAAELMTGTTIRTALVSTNSVTQGETVANLWKPLFEDGTHIDFAHRTFRWDSEAKIKAHVHCVIIGFSYGASKTAADSAKPKRIFDNGTEKIASNINGYLLDAPDIFVESRSKPICNVPQIGIGNQPIDDGNYLFKRDEMYDFLKKEPAAWKYFRPWYGSYEFINRRPRHCLWLGDCPPNELRKMPECMKRVEAVRTFRLASKRSSTLKLANTPTHFQTENMPESTYIIIPRVSSEKSKICADGIFES